MLVAVAALGACAWLVFGRYGSVVLGQDGDAPAFSELSWAAMMFAAGIGVGLMNWSFVEPIHYMATPPMGMQPMSTDAIEWGHMLAMYHWSFVPWAIYTVMAVPVAYTLYVERVPFLRMSSACRSLLGSRVDGILGSAIDTLVILGLVGGVGTSLGFGVPLVAAFTADVLGLPNSTAVQVAVIIGWTSLFSYSAYKGLANGIRILSDINIFLALALIVIVLIAGPTVFILDLTTNSIGMLLDNFVAISFWTDPVDQSGFPETWTIFYWAWWIAFAPMMGLFYGRISKGRTIRQMVVGIIGWGTLGCVTYMAIAGGYSIHLQISGTLDVAGILADKGIPETVLAIIKTLPFSDGIVFIFAILCFVFIATSLDSAAFVLASVSTSNLDGDHEPAKYNRLAWSFVLALVPLGLMGVEGLHIIQSSTIVSSLPVIPVMAVLFLSLMRALRTRAQ